MKTIELKQRNVRKAYNEANSDGKKMLENLIGEEVFKQDITDRVKTYEDSLEETCRPNVLNFGEVPEDLVPFFHSVYRVVVEIEALNEGEKMDIYDSSKRRHYPYFACNGAPSGFAFDDSYYGNAHADAGSGSRLSLPNEKLSNYFGKQFQKDMQDFLTK